MLSSDKAHAPIAGFLVVPNLDRAVAFYSAVFGAVEAERYADKSGKVWYSVLQVLGVPLQLMEPFEDMGLVARTATAREAAGGDHNMLAVTVSDVDDVFQRAIKNGATPVVEPQDAYWGERYAEFVDPFGQRFSACGEEPVLTGIETQADVKAKFDEFLDKHNNPSSPAKIVRAKNVT